MKPSFLTFGLSLALVACNGNIAANARSGATVPDANAADQQIAVATDDEDFTTAHEPASVSGTNLALTESSIQLVIELLVVTPERKSWQVVRFVTYDGTAIDVPNLPRGILRLTGPRYRGIIDTTVGEGSALSLILGPSQQRASDLADRALEDPECRALAADHLFDIASLWQAGALFAAILRQDPNAVLDLAGFVRAFCRANRAEVAATSVDAVRSKVGQALRSAAAPGNIALAKKGTFDLRIAAQDGTKNATLGTLNDAITIFYTATESVAAITADLLGRKVLFYKVIDAATAEQRTVDANSLDHNVKAAPAAGVRELFTDPVEAGKKGLVTTILTNTPKSAAPSTTTPPATEPPVSVPPAPEPPATTPPALEPPPVQPPPAAEPPAAPPPSSPPASDPPASPPPSEPLPARPPPSEPPSPPPPPPPPATGGKSVTITAPALATTWYLGSMHNITWTSAGGVATFNIAYNCDTQGWTNLASNVSATTLYQWTVFGTPGTTCIVRVSDSSDAGVFGLSADIVVPTPSFSLTSPNGGETLAGLATTDIVWTTQFYGGNVDLLYSDDNGSTFTTVATDIANSSPYQWVIPNPSQSQILGRVKVQAHDYSAFQDFSSSSFNVSQAPSGWSLPETFNLLGAAPSPRGKVNVSSSKGGRLVVSYMNTDVYVPTILIYQGGAFGSLNPVSTNGTDTFDSRQVRSVFFDGSTYAVVSRDSSQKYKGFYNGFPSSPWDSGHPVEYAADDSDFPVAAAGSGGFGVFAYRDKNGAQPIEIATVSPQGEIWGHPLGFFNTSEYAGSGAPHVCGNPSASPGRILVVWASSGSVWVASYDGSSFQSSPLRLTAVGGTAGFVDCAMDENGDGIVAYSIDKSNSREHYIASYHHTTPEALTVPVQILANSMIYTRDVTVRINDAGTKAVVFFPFGPIFQKVYAQACAIISSGPASCSTYQEAANGFGTSIVPAGFDYDIADNGDAMVSWLVVDHQHSDQETVQAATYKFADDTWSSAFGAAPTSATGTLAMPGVAYDKSSHRFLYSYARDTSSSGWELITRWYTLP